MRRIHIYKLHAMNRDRAYWNLHIFPLPREVVGTPATDLDCGVGGGGLRDLSDEVREYAAQFLLGWHHGMRNALDHVAVHVPRIGCIAERNLRAVGLVRALHILHEARGTSECNGQKTRRRRVERARVPDAFLLKNTPHDVNDIMRRESRRFQYIDKAVHVLTVQLLPNRREDGFLRLIKGAM